MTITTSLQTNKLKPGVYVEFDVSSGLRGIIPVSYRAALIGTRRTTGTKLQASINQVFTEDEADTYFGQGSELALMCRSAIAAGRKAGNVPELWAVPLDEPGGGTAATYTLTVTGPATASGNIQLQLAGHRILVGVTSGDSANTIAASINTALGQYVTTLPVSSGVASAVVTLTFRHKGVNGNDFDAQVLSVPTGVGVAVAAAVAGVGVTTISTALDVLIDKHYHAIVVANHAAADVTALATYEAARGANGTKRWSFGFIAETGSIATAAALAPNYEYTVVISAEDFPSMTGEVAAAVAITRLAESDPSLTMSDRELHLPLPPAASVYTDTEIETCLAGGCTPLAINSDQTATKIVRLITTRLTVSSIPFALQRDFNVQYTLVNVGMQVDFKIQAFLLEPTNRKNNSSTRKRLRSVLLDLLRQLEGREWLQNVEAHKAELQVETDPDVPSRVNADIPTSVVPGLEQSSNKLRLFVE